MGCGLSSPFITEDGNAQPPATLPSPAPRIDECKHRRSQSQVSSMELGEMDPLIEKDDCVPGRKSVSGRLEGVEDGEQGVAVHLKEVVKNLKEANGEKVVVDEKKKKEENEEKEVEEEEEEKYGSEIGPGSPSFREYCVHPTTTSVDLEQFTHSKSFEPKKEHKHRRRHSIATSEGSNTMLVKKQHKSGRFKIVIPKGGQAAVKNLLNVTSCYCSNPHPHHHLTPATSA